MDLRYVTPKKTNCRFVVSGEKVIGLIDKEKFVARSSFTTKQEESAALYQPRGK